MFLTQTRPILFSLILLLAFISGCSTTTEQPAPPQAELPEQTLLKLYSLAQRSNSPESEKYRLQAATLLISLNRGEEAQTILQNLSVRNLTDPLKTEYVLKSTALALEKFDADAALIILDRYHNLLDRQNNEVLISRARLKANAYELQGQYIKSASQLISITHLLFDDDTLAQQKKIWSLLMHAPVEQLTTAISRQPHLVTLRGWLELARLIKQDNDNLDKQLTSLARWQKQWVTHPAAVRLPDELQLLKAIANNRPNKITLLLPLNGNNGYAGRAIRDGFLAAYYATLSEQGHTPLITLFDTSTTSDFLPLYERATAGQPDLIIGPLEKQKVQKLQSLPNIEVPTLALNYGITDEHKSNLFQFGLSAEEEAQQAAQQAWQDGHKYALALYPDTEWGKRVSAAFQLEWESLIGTMLESQPYLETKGYSDAIKLLLNIDQSEARSKLIRRLAREKINTTPRRRKDVDFIFIVATPEDARQIKPTLAFHFAGNLPVYATSHIYSGIESPRLNRDLNNILFCEIPWMLKPEEHKFRLQISQAWPETANKYGRLYALGADSYRLASRLKQFELIPSSSLQGATGLLSMGGQGHIRRALSWAKIRRGKITPLN